MKTKLLFILFLITFSFFTSCQRSNDELTNTTQTQTQAVTNGNWRVTLFTDSGKDETSDFGGYSFQFGSNGTVTATKTGVTKNGTWSLNSSPTKFTLDMGAKTENNKPLGELTDDWKIISISSTEIKLTDDNPSSNEFLTFTKN